MHLFNLNYCTFKIAIFTFSLEILVNEPNNVKLWYWNIITDSQGAGVSVISQNNYIYFYKHSGNTWVLKQVLFVFDYLLDQKHHLKKCIKFNWNFQRGR